MTKSKLLMGASALIIASLGLADAAQALTQVEGAGSTLIGPYIRQVFDCYGSPTPLVYQGTAAASPPYYPPGSETFSGSALNTGGSTPLPAITPFNYLGTAPFNCNTQHVDTTVQFNYANTGSGNGQLYSMTHDEVTDVGTTTEAGAPPSTVAYGGGQFGMGDFGIGAADVAAYTSGGVLTQKDAGKNLVTIPAGGNAPHYGNFIQFPVSIDPVTIAYAPVYGESEDAAGHVTFLSLRVKKPNKDGSGGLLLDIPTVCAIMNGQITNLADPALTAANGGTQLADLNDPNKGSSWSVPITLVGRKDGSGTTSILYRAMAAQCGQGTITYTEGGDNYVYTNQFGPGGGKNLPTSVPFLLETGSGGVANQLGKAIVPGGPGTTVYQAQIGYIGTDYVLPAVLHTGQNNFGLNVADVIPLGATVGIEPTAATALKAFGSLTTAILPPQTVAGGSGNFTTTTIAATSHGTRAAPQDWAEPIGISITYSDGFTGPTPLADPDTYLGIKTAYPLVGTTQMFLNTCYNDATVTKDLIAFLEYLEDAKLVNDTSALHFGVLESAGLAPLPAAWNNAIENTFVTVVKTGSFATNKLNLNIAQAGTGPTTGAGSQCSAVSPGA